MAIEYHIFARCACTNPAFFLKKNDIFRTGIANFGAGLANYKEVYYCYCYRVNEEGEIVLHTLLIVDDEEIEREGMAQFIPWDTYKM